MARPKHIRSDGQYYFVTTGTHRRAPIFGRADLAKIVIDVLYHIRTEGRIRIHGFFVMPDHLHAVISLVGDNALPPGDAFVEKL
jgi:REP element-mobilizing transposase RayT